MKEKINFRFLRKKRYLILLGFLLLIIISEVTLRITSKQLLCRWIQIKYQPDSIIGRKFLANSEGIKRNSAYTNYYKINNKGFSGKSFSNNKKEGYYRIIIVGASDDHGLLTNGPDSYYKLMTDYIERDQHKIELINCAMSGVGAREQIALIKNECINYEPDLILFRYKKMPFREYILKYRTFYKDTRIQYQNFDQNFDLVKKYLDEKVYKKTFFSMAYNMSYIFRYIIRYYLNAYNEHFRNDRGLNAIHKFLDKYIFNFNQVYAYVQGDYYIGDGKLFYTPVEHDTIEESIAKIFDINDFLQDRGIEFVMFCTYRYRNAIKVKNFFLNNGISLVNLNIEYIDSYGFGKLDGHSSQEGHKTIANSFYQYLIENLVPEEYINK